MEVAFSVAISYEGDLGYIEYDADSKTASVTLANEKGKQLIEDLEFH